MGGIQGLLRAIDSARSSGQDDFLGRDFRVQRVRGGMNNALYRVEMGGEIYACKLCVSDERRRAQREYYALKLLHNEGQDLAPRPIALDESCAILPFPVVVYAWLPGKPLGLPGKPLGVTVDDQQLAAILAGLNQMHALRREDFPDANLSEAFFHWFDSAPYLDELHGLMDQYGGWMANQDPQGQKMVHRLERLVERCEDTFRATDMDLSRQAVALRLCHVDPNPANAIWGPDGRLRWVDWEFSGWGDPSLDLAEWRWHGALSGMSAARHRWLRENYTPPEDDAEFRARLEVWDRLLVTRWPLLVLRWLWSLYNGPDRQRLTMPDVDPAELRQRLARFIERAEV